MADEKNDETQEKASSEESSEKASREMSDELDTKAAAEEADAAADEADEAAAEAEAAADDAKDSEHVAERAARDAEYDEDHSESPRVEEATAKAEATAERAHADRDDAKEAASEAKKDAKAAHDAAAEGDPEAAKAAAAEAKAEAARAKADAKDAEDAAEEAIAAMHTADEAKLAHADEDLEPEKRPALYLAQYETPNELVAAAEKVRDAGYESWDCHTPYPMHGLDEAMGLRPTKIGIISFVAGMTGLVTAVLMIQFMNNWDYPINIGGKPVGAGAFPSMVPIMFELTILLTGFGTLFGLLHLARLPRHHHPIFESDRFEAATDDKFFISIEVEDEKFDLDKTRALLESTEPSHLELVEEEIG